MEDRVVRVFGASEGVSFAVAREQREEVDGDNEAFGVLGSFAAEEQVVRVVGRFHSDVGDLVRESYEKRLVVFEELERIPAGSEVSGVLERAPRGFEVCQDEEAALVDDLEDGDAALEDFLPSEASIGREEGRGLFVDEGKQLADVSLGDDDAWGGFGAVERREAFAAVEMQVQVAVEVWTAVGLAVEVRERVADARPAAAEVEGDERLDVELAVRARAGLGVLEAGSELEQVFFVNVGDEEAFEGGGLLDAGRVLAGLDDDVGEHLDEVGVRGVCAVEV